MKTKSICILLLTFLLCLRASSHNCICLPEVVERAVIAIVAVAADVCSDCGHSKSCCIATQDAETSGAITIGSAPVLAHTLPVTRFFVEVGHAPTEPACNRYINKAPPWQIRPSPISLHQKLTV